MFELKGIRDAVPTNQLLIYYGLIIVTYIVFFKKIRFTNLTILLLLVFNRGIIQLIDPTVFSYKIISSLLILVIFFKNHKKIRFSKRIKGILITALVFFFTIFLSYIINGNKLLIAVLQLREEFFAILLLVVLNLTKLKKSDIDYYLELILKLIGFQIIFSIYKLLIIGFRENIVGSITNEGGDAAVYLALLGLVIYWIHRGNKFSLRRDWPFVLSLLIIPMLSDKRAIWLIYPFVLVYILYKKSNRVNYSKILPIMLLIPILIYFGFRFNPSFNPEKKLWGSFDFNYAINFILNYSGVSEDKMQADYNEGRLGTAISIGSQCISNLDSIHSWIGYTVSREGKVGIDDSIAIGYGLKGYGALLAAIGKFLIMYGLLGTLFCMMLNIKIAQLIGVKKNRRIFIILFLWDFIFYSGIFSLSIFSVIVISLVAKKSKRPTLVSEFY